MPTKPSSTNIPKNWPPHLPYLMSPSYSPRLSPAQRSSLCVKPNDAVAVLANTPKGPCPVVKIVEIEDAQHPVYGQCGLFAARDLKPGSYILEYLGVIHASPASSSSSPSATPSLSASTSAPPDPHATSNYDLSLDRDSHLAIDAALSGNEARFLNDYRGVAERPNAEFREVWHAGRGERGMAVWVLPVGKARKGRRVRKGEEILVSYGRGFWGARKDGDGVEGAE